jgi:hypothetical protein
MRVRNETKKGYFGVAIKPHIFFPIGSSSGRLGLRYAKGLHHDFRWPGCSTVVATVHGYVIRDNETGTCHGRYPVVSAAGIPALQTDTCDFPQHLNADTGIVS